MIWISVPESSLDRIVRDLVAQTPLLKAPFTRTMLVLCNCARDSRAPGPLLGTGARVASLNLVPDTQERIFVAEGHPETIRALRALLALDKRKLIRLEPAAKPLFFAGVNLSAALLLPWFASGMECLRAAGFTRAEAVKVGEILGVRALRKYGKAGPKAWSRHTTSALSRALEQDLVSIRSHKPRLADLYEQGIQVALAHFLEPPKKKAHHSS